jgi:hypothetical protein
MHGPINVTMHGHMNVTMHGHMNVTMHGHMNVTVHGHMNVTVHGHMNVTMHGHMNVAVHGHINVTMHGHMNVTMHGHMNVTVHGHMNVKFVICNLSYMQKHLPKCIISSDLCRVFRYVTVGVVGEYLYQESIVAQLEFYPDIWLEEELRATTIFFITYIRNFNLDLDPGHREYTAGVVATRILR